MERRLVLKLYFIHNTTFQCKNVWLQKKKEYSLSLSFCKKYARRLFACLIRKRDEILVKKWKRE